MWEDFWYHNKEIVAGLLIGVIVVGIIFGIAAIVKKNPEPPKPCSYYADWAMQDVPARCIKEFQK